MYDVKSNVSLLTVTAAGTDITTCFQICFCCSTITIKIFQKPKATANVCVRKVSPNICYLPVTSSHWVLSHWTVNWLPIHNRLCVITRPSPPSTFLKVVLNTVWGTIMNVFTSHRLTPIPNATIYKNNSDYSIRLSETLQDDVLIVLRSIGMVHPKETIITELWRASWIIGIIS